MSDLTPESEALLARIRRYVVHNEDGTVTVRDVAIRSRLAAIEAAAIARYAEGLVDRWPDDGYRQWTVSIGWVDGVVEQEASGPTLHDAARRLLAIPEAQEAIIETEHFIFAQSEQPPDLRVSRRVDDGSVGPVVRIPEAQEADR